MNESSKQKIGLNGVFSKPPEGSWGKKFPFLSKGPVSFEDSVSPEFFELEREALFRRLWLMVGRVEEVPNIGSYFTKDIPHCNVSLVVVRGQDNKIRTFHNVCSHRGNKLVWDEYPRNETSGTCRQFRCKYHAWRYALDGELTHVTLEQDFQSFDKKKYGLAAVHTDVWEGFIFVNLAEHPQNTLREYLGDMILGIGGYPFDKFEKTHTFRTEVNSNWKLLIDGFQESYHGPYLHSKVFEGLASMPDNIGSGFIDVRFDGPHRVFSAAGSAADSTLATPTERLFEGGLWGPCKTANLGFRTMADLPRSINAQRASRWGIDAFQIFPNATILIWQSGYYVTYAFWPVTVDRHIMETKFYFLPTTSVRERLANEMTVLTFKEAVLQDMNTLEATHSMLKTGVRKEFLLCDEEIMVRHLHHTAVEYVRDYQRKQSTRG